MLCVVIRADARPCPCPFRSLLVVSRAERRFWLRLWPKPLLVLPRSEDRSKSERPPSELVEKRADVDEPTDRLLALCLIISPLARFCCHRRSRGLAR